MLTLVNELYVVIAILSIIPLFGAAFGYFTFHRLKEDESVFTLFSAYLMLLLGTFLFFLSVIKSKISPGLYLDGGKGFLIGFVIVLVLMSLYHRFATNAHSRDNHSHSHYSMGLILFFMLMVHEMLEGLVVADIFFEMSGGAAPILASVASLLVLALHEFPEGMMLVMPFFLAGEKKKGLWAVLINVSVFAGSALFAYFVFLRHIELTPYQEALLAGIPAGGIFFLGIHEAKTAYQTGIRGASRSSKAMLGAISFCITGVIIFVLIHTNENIETKKEVHISGYEKSATGELIPIIYADPCAHEINLHDCLD